MTAVGWTGQPVRRVEDAELLTGAGRYLDDIRLPGMLHLAVVRSPVAHALLGGIDTAAAAASPGVRLVLTGADVAGLSRLPVASDSGAQVFGPAVPILASERVRFAGEPVAVVVAESRAAAVDAAELVDVEYQELPAVTDPAAALAGQVVLHGDATDNVMFRWHQASGDVDAAFASAAAIVRADLELPRLAAAPLEPRGCLAAYDAAGDYLTVHASAQDPHRPRRQLAAVFGRTPESIRVIVPNVGGSFGSKSMLAPEAFATVLAALRLGRPVKWVETRSENFLAAYQGRGLRADCELAVAADGRFLALCARLTSDVGAYLYPVSPVPAVHAGTLATGCYDIPAASVEVTGVATNKVPTGPYRGAGRPEGAFIAERLADLTAAELGLDRAEIRRRNLIGPDAMPYRTAVGTTIDSGDFPRLLDRALELLDYDAALAEQRQARDRGEIYGVGMSVFLEPGGMGLWESAAVSVRPGGQVVAAVGSTAHGQGHQTAFAQLLADELGVPPAAIEIRAGDTATVPVGLGTFGSRSAITGGSALILAARELKATAIKLASERSGVPPAELAWRQGKIHGAGPPIDPPELSVTAGELSASAVFRLEQPVYSSGAYAAIVSIDASTGVLRVDRLVAAHDAGKVLNPLIAEGQVTGGTLQGFGEAVSEQVSYDADGQLLTGSFLSYGILSATEAPVLQSEFVEVPSPLNPLGVRGVGETGATGVPAVIASAVTDALSPLGVRHLDPPYTPEVLHAAVAVT